MTHGRYSHQAPLSMEFFRQEYWSRLPFPPAEDPPDPRTEPTSLLSPALAGGFFTTVPLSKPPNLLRSHEFLRNLKINMYPFFFFPKIPHMVPSQMALVVKEPACQCRWHKRHGFDPWVGEFPWRRKWHPTPVCLPGKFHGQRILAGYSPWGRKKSDTTEVT